MMSKKYFEIMAEIFFCRSSRSVFLGGMGILCAIFILSSCSINDDQEPRIRIVDSSGRPGKVVTRMPELNNQAMAMQAKPKDSSGGMEEVTTPRQNDRQNNPQKN